MGTVFLLIGWALAHYTGYMWGRERGRRIGLREAVKVAAEAEVDPRPAFKEWLKGLSENK